MLPGPDKDLHHADLDHLRHASTMFNDTGLYCPEFKFPIDPANSPSIDQDWAVPFTHIVLDTGDVLVYIDMPTVEKQRHTINCEGVVFHNLKFYVHSHNLLALGDTKFKRLMLNKRKQQKWRDMRKPTEQEMKGVEFILDLTPDMEGDDRVFELAELSLTKGIVDWWAADKMHQVPENLVRGHDDICTCRLPRKRDPAMEERLSVLRASSDKDVTQEPVTEPVTLPPLPSDLQRLRAQGVNELFETPLCHQIPDYCPFRHCNSIARLLLAIEGKGVRYNSAARVWTMVGVSKIYECPSVVRDAVVQWILSNARFVEVLPEETLRMGFNLTLPQITQSAFRILVNEMALEETADQQDQNQRGLKFTIFGRRKEDPGDDKSNAIQHAARALVERVRKQRDVLISPDLFDSWVESNNAYWGSSIEVGKEVEWKKLKAIEQLLVANNDGKWPICKALITLRSFMAALVHKITDKADNLSSDSDYCRSAYAEMDKDRATYVKPDQFDQIQYIVPYLTQDQRLLLPFFYNELGRQCEGGIYWGQKSTHPDNQFKFFSQILCELEENIQKLIADHPARAYHDDWQILFKDTDPLAEVVGPFFQTTGRRIKSPLINLGDLEEQVRSALRPVMRAWERIDKGFVPQLNITRHMLLTLTNNEMKFLPLWAGGNDDGTGGVFEDTLPEAELGPNGPGPAYHTGITVPSDGASLSGSFVDDIRAFNIKGSTTAGSIAVHDSVSTVYNPKHVIAADSSIAPSSYGGDEAEFSNARFQVPAEHQSIGQALAMLVDDDPNGAYGASEIDQGDSDDTLTEIGQVSDDDGDEEMVDRLNQAKGKEPMVTDDGKSVISESDAKSTTTDSDNDSMVMV